MSTPLARRALAELIGTAFLVAAVIGSGIAASRLSPNDVGLQLLENAAATAGALIGLILMLGAVSGAHFNPVVTLAERLLHGGTGASRGAVEIAGYVAAQCAGGVAGAVLADAMFDVAVSISTTRRSGTGLLLGEVVATAGVVVAIFALARAGRAALTPLVVAAWIGAAYWFTSSTSFANPAVTVGRMFSDTFAGIAPSSVPPFVLAQLAGALAGIAALAAFYPTRTPPVLGQPAAERLDPATGTH